MSTEIYLQWFPDRRPAGLPTSEVLAVMSPSGEADQFGFYSLVYDELHQCDFSLTVENGVVVALTVLRPCDDDRLYQVLFRLLQKGRAVAFAPGSPPIVADASVANFVPSSMQEALGNTVRAADAANLRDLLFAA